MIKKLLAPDSFSDKWLFPLRVIVGSLIFQHGLGIFNLEEMQGNIAWLTDIHLPVAHGMAYLGKTTELVGGILIFLGLLTRFACLCLIINMAMISFVMLKGIIFGDGQLPFLLLLFCILFFIKGSGKQSLDQLLFRQNPG
jgi:putative oxidoreductase